MRLNMREYLVKKTIDASVIITKEDFLAITEDKVSRIISLDIGLYDQEGVLVTTEFLKVVGDHYDVLMSESPPFAPGKPANEYREVDLWYIVDQVRS